MVKADAASSDSHAKDDPRDLCCTIPPNGY